MAFDLSSFDVEKMKDKDLRDAVRLLLVMSNKAFEEIDKLIERIEQLENSK